MLTLNLTLTPTHILTLTLTLIHLTYTLVDQVDAAAKLALTDLVTQEHTTASLLSQCFIAQWSLLIALGDDDWGICGLGPSKVRKLTSQTNCHP